MSFFHKVCVEDIVCAHTARTSYLTINLEVRHPRCVGSITKNFLCITRTVKHNYNSPISTVRIQLHVSALYVGYLQVEIF